MKKKALSLLIATAMTVASVAGCGSKDASKAATGSSTGEAGTGADTQVVNVRVSSFGNNYDVQDMGWRWMMAACYDGLYRDVADENGDVFELAGAESVDISDDNLVYTYHLRKDAKWSDGVAVTAHDYEYGWKRLLNPEFAYDYASFIYNVVGAEEYNKGEGSADDVEARALDDYTFQVTLKIPDPTFEAKLVATPLYPTRQDIAEAAGDNWGKDWTLCVYNGPYVMSDLVEDNSMTWSKNPEYWNADAVSLETINWYIVDEDSTAATMFDNGELDLIQTSGDYLLKYQEQVANGDIKVMTTDYPGTVYLNFNHVTGGTSGLVGNAKIRKAISYAINREDIIDSVYGRYEPAYSYIAPAITFEGTSYRDQASLVIYDEYSGYVDNPEALQALFQEGLDELGVTTPLSDITITFLSSGSTIEASAEREYLQQTIQNNLGINVELNTVGDSSLFKAERDAGNYDILYAGWYSDYNDPLDFLYTFYTDAYGDSFCGYSNPKYDALLDQLTGETDAAKRLEIYQEAEKLLLLDDAAIIPIYHSTRTVFMHNWVDGFLTSSFGASQEFIRTSINGRGF